MLELLLETFENPVFTVLFKPANTLMLVTAFRILLSCGNNVLTPYT